MKITCLFRYYKRLKIVYFGTAVTEQLVRAEPFVFSWHPHMYMSCDHVTVIISVVSPLCGQVSFLVLKL